MLSKARHKRLFAIALILRHFVRAVTWFRSSVYRSPEYRWFDGGNKLVELSNYLSQKGVYTWDATTPYIRGGTSFKLDTSPQTTSGEALYFNDTGTVLYILSDTPKKMFTYNLTVAYDVSTAVYAGAATDYTFGAQLGDAYDFEMNDTGTKVYITDQTNKDIKQYNLATPWDMATATYGGAITISNPNHTPYSIQFNDQGTLAYVLEYNTSNASRLFEYALNTPYDMGSITTFTDRSPTGNNQWHDDVIQFSLTQNETLFILLRRNTATSYYYIEYRSGDYWYFESSTVLGGINNNVSPVAYTIVDGPGTFVDANNDGFLDGGITISNLPAGLTAQWQLYNNDTEVRLQLLGTATNQDNLDDLASLSVNVTAAATTTELPM